MSLLYKDTPVGFHRVLSGPLDDHEIFTSNEELLEYCKSGTAYNGQRVLLTYNGLFDQPCVIKKGRQSELLIPILELPAGIELITTKDEYNNIYALVAFFNDGDILYSDNKDIMMKLDDFCYFSILALSAILYGSSENIEYKFEYKNGITETVTSGDVTANTAGDIINKVKDNLYVGNRFKVWIKCNNYYNAMGV